MAGRRGPAGKAGRVSADLFRVQPSAVPAETLEAYQHARYVVHAPTGDIELRVGQLSPALDLLLKAEGASGGVLITAYNPRGESQPEAANRAAQERLQADLRNRGCRWIPAIGEDPQGRWAAETSVLALDLAPAQADALGQEYGQNAYVLCALKAPPTLVVLR